MTDDDRIQELLEQLSSKAKRGEILAVAVAVVENDNTAGTSYVLGGNAARLYYAVSTLAHRVLLAEEEA